MVGSIQWFISLTKMTLGQVASHWGHRKSMARINEGECDHRKDVPCLVYWPHGYGDDIYGPFR